MFSAVPVPLRFATWTDDEIEILQKYQVTYQLSRIEKIDIYTRLDQILFHTTYH